MVSLTVTAREKTEVGSFIGPERLVGTVGFAGHLQGLLCLHFSPPFAQEMTAMMLGMEPGDVEEFEDINDAIGELTNIIAGDLKTRFSRPGNPCSLSIPSITRGTRVEIESVTGAERHCFFFMAGNNPLLVELYIRESVA
jgi:chemotaxis protein CheX